MAKNKRKLLFNIFCKPEYIVYIRIKLNVDDFKNILYNQQFILYIIKYFSIIYDINCYITGSIIKKAKTKITLLKSPHVNKKAQDNFVYKNIYLNIKINFVFKKDLEKFQNIYELLKKYLNNKSMDCRLKIKPFFINKYKKK